MQNAFFRGCFITFYAAVEKLLVERSKHVGRFVESRPLPPHAGKHLKKRRPFISSDSLCLLRPAKTPGFPPVKPLGLACGYHHQHGSSIALSLTGLYYYYYYYYFLFYFYYLLLHRRRRERNNSAEFGVQQTHLDLLIGTVGSTHLPYLVETRRKMLVQKKWRRV